MSSTNADITTHLNRLSDGDVSSVSALMPQVYDELRRIAAAHLARERANHTLQPTALAHEAYLKLVDQKRARWNDRAHFLAIAAEVIRRILIDHARLRQAAKRGGGQRLTLGWADDQANAHDDVDLIELEDALERLAQRSARQAKVVELRFFAGLEVKETAEVLGVSPRTVKGDWRVARAWLARELGKMTER
jgi:RNA polymerase sigma factor (TIGR02999 family)